MVIDATLAHAVEGEGDGGPELGIPGALSGPPHHLQKAGLGEFGRALQAAIGRVEHLHELGRGRVEVIKADGDTVLGLGRLLEPLHDGLGVGADLVPFLVVGVGHLLEHLGKAGPPIAGLGREIGAAPEGRPLPVQEHGERPAAMLAQLLKGGHVDLVDVRPLLPVHLDVHEKRVHLAGDLGVLEAFMGHHMAPVAGRIAHREQHRPAGAARLLERFGPPGPPMDRIVLMLKQIGAGLGGEAIFAHGKSLWR